MPKTVLVGRYLVKQFSDEFQVRFFRFLVDDTGSLLCHEQTEWNRQPIVD